MSPWFKLLVWIGIAWWVGKKVKPVWAFGFLAVFGTIQALLGIAQFTNQSDLGLQVLGESVLSHLNRDVARTFVEGGRLLRAYGTFPHPNILAAFLTLSLLALYYFWMVNKNRTTRLAAWQVVVNLLTIPLFINWLGLLLTFSRAGWLIALLSNPLFLAYSFILRSQDKRRLLFLIIVNCLIITGLVLIFSWAVFPRVEFIDKFSFENRINDYQYAWQKIQEKPFFGHGLTLAMGERPIHNLYLTVAVEVGLTGLLIFLVFVINTLIQNFNLERSVLPTMFLALLLFGLTDHFLWTLRPGLAMFWMIIGLLAFSPRS